MSNLSAKEIIDLSEVSKLNFIVKENTKLEDFDFISLCFDDNIFMKNLNKNQRREVIQCMSLVAAPSKTTLFEQNGVGNYFYILKEGSVEIKINDKYVKSMGAGSSFGELALLYQAPRSAKVMTELDSYMWVLERKTFRKVVDKLNRINYEEHLRFIKSVSILSFVVTRQVRLRATVNIG